MGSKQEAVNSFDGGMISDLNAISTPKNVLTYAKNATFITFNGNELVLQNDMGNSSITDAKLSDGFIPIGVKEHGGIIYIVSYNPTTKETELGSFPSPDFVTLETNGERNVDLGSKTISYDQSPFYLLSDDVLNTGDPFIVNFLPTVADLLTTNTTRNYYIPKLLAITNNGEKDITEDVKRQTNLLGGSSWFTTQTLENSLPILNKEAPVYYYPNIISGKLGVRFQLESIDYFDINPGKYGKLPTIKQVGQDWKLIFEGFTLTQPAKVKCNTVLINLVLTDIATQAVTIKDEEIIVSSTDTSVQIPEYEYTIGTTKDFILSYTITPKFIESDQIVIFTPFILRNYNIDLSKDSSQWGYRPQYVLDQSTIFDQKILPASTTIGNIEFYTTSLIPVTNTIVPSGTTDYSVNYLLPRILNSNWLSKTPSTNLRASVDITGATTYPNEVSIHTIIGGISSADNDVFLDYIKIQDGDLGKADIAPYTSWTAPNGSLVKFPKKLNNVFDFGTSCNPITRVQLRTYKVTQGIVTIGYEFSHSVKYTSTTNDTGWRIQPMFKRVSSSGLPLRKDIDGAVDIITPNINNQLLTNTDFLLTSTGIATNWLGDYTYLTLQTSIVQKYCKLEAGKYMVQALTISKSCYYVLTFYATGWDNLMITCGGVTTTITINGDTPQFYNINLNLPSGSENLALQNAGSTTINIYSISLKEKLNNDNTVEYKQAVVTYSENVTVVEDPLFSNHLVHQGIYIPSANYEMVGNFTLTGSDLTLSTAQPSINLPSTTVRI